MDINIKLQILKSSPLFKNFSHNSLKALVEKTQIQTYQEDTTLYKEGDYGDSFYVIAIGRVTLYKRVEDKMVPLYTLEKGDYFGEMAYFNQTGSRTVSAKVHAHTVLFKIPHAFLVLIQQNSSVSYNLIKAMNVRQRKVYTKLAAVSAAENSKHHLNTLSEKAGAKITIDDSLLSKHIEETLNPKKEDPLKAKDCKTEKETPGEEVPVEKMLYDRNFSCPYCKSKFITPRVLSKYLKITKTDDDFCSYYDGINPIFYEVAVCPRCNYAFTDDSQDKLGPTALKGVKAVLETLPKKDYCLVRDINLAVETFILAILCQTAYENKDSLIARLYLRMAWLYRYQKNKEKEHTYLQVALEKYESAFKKEKFEIKNELQLTYLVGELYNRLGNAKMAVQWFNKLVMHPKKDQYPAIVKKARDRWQDIRAEMKKKKA
ncbi:uncharacterized protein (DUF2225 family)/CRP-like cAMP-binding protein [Desulfohalotomaculum tongense]|uniref:DUF2225 domain-containing protein n=1 Tax=Desulforadius tongensis TaxID=1216062 RepID=UPI00195CE2A1|nr:DUF2225 domain-containing protein [Desulforadius tongensis]MBM7854204.1 uncharacterized protein (DUF2225 family)/CRP-like cAMP-binding protein [Desulforadius tongensis]